MIDEIFVRVLNRHASAEEIQTALATITLIQKDHERLAAQLAEAEALGRSLREFEERLHG